MKKNLFLIGLMSAFLHSSDENLLTKQVNELIVSETLKLNTDKNKRIISYKSLEQGIEDLKKIARTEALEEVYVFFPKKNLWVELGFDEKFVEYEEGIVSNVTFNLGYLEKLVNNYGSAVVFHTHPDRALEKKEEKIESRIQKKEERKNYIGLFNSILKQEEVEISLEAIPSLTDLNVLNRILNNHKILRKNEYGIVSPNHVTMYSLTLNPDSKFNYKKNENEVLSLEDLFKNVDTMTNKDTLLIKGSNLKIKIY